MRIRTFGTCVKHKELHSHSLIFRLTIYEQFLIWFGNSVFKVFYVYFRVEIRFFPLFYFLLKVYTHANVKTCWKPKVPKQVDLVVLDVPCAEFDWSIGTCARESEHSPTKSTWRTCRAQHNRFISRARQSSSKKRLWYPSNAEIIRWRHLELQLGLEIFPSFEDSELQLFSFTFFDWSYTLIVYASLLLFT